MAISSVAAILINNYHFPTTSVWKKQCEKKNLLCSEACLNINEWRTKVSRMENCLFSSQLFFLYTFLCTIILSPQIGIRAYRSRVHTHKHFFSLFVLLLRNDGIHMCKLPHLNTIGKWSFSGVIHAMTFFGLCFRFFSTDEIVNCSTVILFFSSAFSLNQLYVNVFFSAIFSIDLHLLSVERY